ncbi:nicotinate-nucleotide--dimethylbenzimidazole phosphoribosyltransferase, partial [Frankia sp. CNm7]
MENPQSALAGTAPPAAADWVSVAHEIGDVPEPDAAVAAAEQAAARRRARALDLPADALGRLGDVAVWLAAAQGVSPPRPITRARAVLVAADHGIADAGLYPWPAGATARRIAAVESGASALAVLARRAGIGLRLVDVAVAAPAASDASAPDTPASGDVVPDDVASTPDASTPDVAAPADVVSAGLGEAEAPTGDVVVAAPTVVE